MPEIQIGGKNYPIRFDMNILELVQNRYESISNMFSEIQKISESKWILAQLIREGIAYQSYTVGTSELQPPTEQDIGMLMSAREMSDGQLTQKIVNAFNDCFGGEKNVTAGELIEIARMTQKSTSPA